MSELIVIPARDAARTIGPVVAHARAWAPVLVIDDGSSDRTAATARAAGAAVVRHERPLGRAKTLHAATVAARDHGAETVVVLGSAECAGAVPVVLNAARHDTRAIVLGRREAHIDGERGRGTPGAHHRPPRSVQGAGVQIVGFFASWASGARLADPLCGVRAYPAEALEQVCAHRRARPHDIAARRNSSARLPARASDVAVLMHAVARGWRVIEVPVRVPSTDRTAPTLSCGDALVVATCLARGVSARWLIETMAGIRELTGAVRGERRRSRHAALLAEAAPFAGAPGEWALAIGVAQSRRLADTVAEWRRDPRFRRARIAARATTAAPLVLAALAIYAIAGRVLPDVLTRLVSALYSVDALDDGPIAAPEGARSA